MWVSNNWGKGVVASCSDRRSRTARGALGCLGIRCASDIIIVSDVQLAPKPSVATLLSFLLLLFRILVRGLVVEERVQLGEVEHGLAVLQCWPVMTTPQALLRSTCSEQRL